MFSYEQSHLIMPKAPSGAQMLVSGAWGARNQHFKISGPFSCRGGFFMQFSGALAPEKIAKNRWIFASFGPFKGRSAVVRPGEAVNKSAASAASLDGFSSRDQVGC